MIFQEETPEKATITITKASMLVGLHPRTLMLYEFEKLVIPKRNPANRRLYSPSQIKELEFMQFLTRKKGLNYAGIRIVKEMIKHGYLADLNLIALVFPEYQQAN